MTTSDTLNLLFGLLLAAALLGPIRWFIRRHSPPPPIALEEFDTICTDPSQVTERREGASDDLGSRSFYLCLHGGIIIFYKFYRPSHPEPEEELRVDMEGRSGIRVRISWQEGSRVAFFVQRFGHGHISDDELADADRERIVALIIRAIAIDNKMSRPPDPA